MTEKITRDLIDEETTRSLMEVLMNTDNVDKYLKDNKDSLNPYMTFIEYTLLSCLSSSLPPCVDETEYPVEWLFRH